MDLIEILCPVCNSGNYDTVFKEKQFNKYPLNVSICVDCGLMYLNPRLTESGNLSFYEEEYDSFHRRHVLKNDTHKPEYNKIINLCERMKKNEVFPGSAENILEIGCGMGWNLKYLKDKFFFDVKLFAIEPSKHCIRNINKLNINLISNDVDAEWHIKFKNKFDFILIRQALEHFLYPLSVLKKAFHVLKEDGTLYIDVPNSMNPPLPLKYNFYRIDHLFYFSKTTLLNLIGMAGFKEKCLSTCHKEGPYVIFAAVNKSKSLIAPIISEREYRSQRDLLMSLSRKEKTISFKINYFSDQLKCKMISFFKSFLKRIFKKLRIYNMVKKPINMFL